MTWNPNPTVTINGTAYTDKSLAGLSIKFGRDSIWEQPRSGYAIINVLNATNSDFGFQPKQAVTIKVKNSANADVTLFTGTIVDISNRMVAAGSTTSVGVQQITAVTDMAKMARTQMSASFAKEYDDIRMTNILTAAGVSVDVIDTPGVYELKVITGDYADCYTLAAKYAQMAFGYIYDTTANTIGYANESRRFVDQRDNGYFNIPKSYLLAGNLSSTKTANNLLNDLILSYGSGSTVTSEDLSSQTAYGIFAGNVSTELHDSAQAQTQADRYITLRSTPRTSIGSVTIPVGAEFVSNTNRDKFLAMRMGLPIQIDSLPNTIKNSTYKAFVEGWEWNISRTGCDLTINSSDSQLSVTPTRWQDVSALTRWTDVAATLQWSDYE